MRSGVYHCAQQRSNAINGDGDNGASYARAGQTSDFRQHAMRDGGKNWSSNAETKNRYGVFFCGYRCCVLLWCLKLSLL